MLLRIIFVAFAILRAFVARSSECCMYMFNVGAANFILIRSNPGTESQKNLIVDCGYDSGTKEGLEATCQQFGTGYFSKDCIVKNALDLMRKCKTSIIILIWIVITVGLSKCFLD